MSSETTVGRYAREVEAVRYIPGESCAVLHAWVGSEGCEGECLPGDVFMLSGDVEVRPGAWVIREPASGRLAVWSDSQFRKMHRAASEECAECSGDGTEEDVDDYTARVSCWICKGTGRVPTSGGESA